MKGGEGGEAAPEWRSLEPLPRADWSGVGGQENGAVTTEERRVMLWKCTFDSITEGVCVCEPCCHPEDNLQVRLFRSWSCMHSLYRIEKYLELTADTGKGVDSQCP